MNHLGSFAILTLAISACATPVWSNPQTGPTHQADFELSESVNKDRTYPEAWWSPAPREGAPDWEILPQEAGPGEVILSKRTELGIFSNFAATPITLDGKTYASVEGFWQMMKFPENAQDPRATFHGLAWPFERAAVGQMVGFEAKRAGDAGSTNMRTMGINWVTWNGVQLPYRVLEKGEHYKLIRRAMAAKLEQNPDVKRLLLATGDLMLKPDHKQDANTPPAWEYFTIWMELRAELNGTNKSSSHH